jgi:hypothetical protein
MSDQKFEHLIELSAEEQAKIAGGINYINEFKLDIFPLGIPFPRLLKYRMIDPGLVVNPKKQIP